MIFTHCMFLDPDELHIEPSSYSVTSYYGTYVTSIAFLDSIKKFMGARKRQGYKLTAMRNYTHTLVVF